MSAPLIQGGYPPLELPDNVSLSQFFLKYNPDSVPSSKVIHTDSVTGKELTYGGLRTEAAKCAWGLQTKLGLKEGNIVLIMVPNYTDFVLLTHSVLWAGGVVSPLNIGSTVKDIIHVLNMVQPTHICVWKDGIVRMEAAIQDCAAYFGKERPRLLTVVTRIRDYTLFPDDISGRSPNESVPPYDLNGKKNKDVCAMIGFSSGTTGKVKGVMLSHRNLAVNMLQMRAALPTNHNNQQRDICFVPYTHAYGIATAVLSPMWAGSFVCGMPSFDPQKYCELNAKYKTTVMHLVPPVALLLASTDLAKQYDLSSVRNIFIAAAPLKEALQRKLKSRFPNAAVTQIYGMTECSPAVAVQHPSREEYIGSVGTLLPDTQYRLVDPNTLKDVPIGQPGELWVKGPQVMLGYLKNDAANKEVMHNEWYRSGDILTVDEHGQFYVTDRLKEMIKYKGFQIAPSELEDLLVQHPDVIDAAVCAVYDDLQATEVPLAYVSLREEHLRKESRERLAVLERVREWVDGRVAGYKRLRGGVHHLQVLPKNPSGKILRKELPVKIKERQQNKL